MDRIAELAGAMLTGTRLFRTLLAKRSVLSVGSAYIRHWRRNRRLGGREAISFASFVLLCADHWHLYTISQTTSKIEIGTSRPETLRPMPTDEDLYLRKTVGGRA
jgi:hypothetical protein